MTGRRVFSETLAVIFLSVLFGFSFCGKSQAGGSDDLVAKLGSADPAKLSSVMDGLRKTADDKTVDTLIKIVEERRDDWKLQIAAIRLLGEIGNPVATDLLIKVVIDHFFSNECPALKWNGIVALGNFRNDPRVVGALLYRLDEDTLYIREAVIQSLGKIGNREALPYLIAALGDKHFAVRMSAVRALGTMKDPQAIPSLERVAAVDSDPLIRNEAVKTLDGRTRWK